MKRENHLFERIASMDNLRLADAIAQENKRDHYGVIRHNMNAEADLLQLHESLLNKTLLPPVYSIFKVHDPKERDVFSSPYYPNLILDYAILLVIGPTLEKTYTADSYACIKGRGVHKAGNNLKMVLRYDPENLYYLKLDIKKFYPSINHDILKAQLRRKFKDPDLFWLLDMIIDAAPGLPIGRYLSQTLSNFHLSPFDHWIKEELRVADYFRYVDDAAIISRDKSYLHDIRKKITEYLWDTLKLELKHNWRVAPVICGLDIFGYKYYGYYTLMRKRNKQNFARAVANGASRSVIAGHIGWAKHCNSKHLLKKLLPNEKV